MEGCERGGSQFWFQGVVFWIALSKAICISLLAPLLLKREGKAI